MPDPSEGHHELSAVRQTLAMLRTRIEKQEADIAAGFRSLREELDQLDRQCRRLAVAPQPATMQTVAPSRPLDPPPGVIPIRSPNAPMDPPTIPVRVELSEIAGDVSLPVGTAITPAGQLGDTPDASEFEFNREVPTTEIETTDIPTVEPIPITVVATSANDRGSQVIQQSITDLPTTFQLSDGEEIDMEQVLFGPELAANQSLFSDRQTLLQGLLNGSHDALTLLGQLMIFRGATPDRMAGLLKDVGEAYYRWRPEFADGADPFRDELTGWLQRKCEEGGVPNSIELVRPGDRFDSKRHHAKDRGVEVAEVRGWVVLRDNGKVYTKASVTLK